MTLKAFLKDLSKTIFKSRPMRLLMCRLIAWIIQITYALSRKSFHVDDAALPFHRGEKNAIYVFWHGRNVMVHRLRPKNRQVYAMISLHRDGEWLAQTLRYLGIHQVRGSSHKGGANAAREAIEILHQDRLLAITPDGPRGPRYIAKAGPVAIARLTQTPIIPCSFSTSRAHTFKSWDRYLWPLPFGHLHFCVGAPIFPHADEREDESMRALMEEAINHETARADALAGYLDF